MSSEYDLLLSCKHEEYQDQALIAAFNQYKPLVYKRANKIVRLLDNRQEVDDIVQEVFINFSHLIYKYNLNRIKEKENFSFYIIFDTACKLVYTKEQKKMNRERICVEKCKQNYKKESESKYFIPYPDLHQKIIEEVTKNYTPIKKEIFKYYFVDGKSYDEIAKIKKFSKAGVSWHVVRMKKDIKEITQKHSLTVLYDY